MYQLSKVCVENEGRLEASPWTKTLVPGGTRGVALNPKLSFMVAWAERIGFVQEERIRLRVRTAWGMRQFHSWDVKLGSQEASPAQR